MRPLGSESARGAIFAVGQRHPRSAALVGDRVDNAFISRFVQGPIAQPWMICAGKPELAAF